jgi:hypothetical protein
MSHDSLLKASYTSSLRPQMLDMSHDSLPKPFKALYTSSLRPPLLEMSHDSLHEKTLTLPPAPHSEACSY